RHLRACSPVLAQRRRAPYTRQWPSGLERWRRRKSSFPLGGRAAADPAVQPGHRIRPDLGTDPAVGSAIGIDRRVCPGIDTALWRGPDPYDEKSFALASGWLAVARAIAVGRSLARLCSVRRLVRRG